MSCKTAKKQRQSTLKGYREAGQLYWTADMEKAIRKIHRHSEYWMTAAIAEGLIIIAVVIYHFYG